MPCLTLCLGSDAPYWSTVLLDNPWPSKPSNGPPFFEFQCTEQEPYFFFIFFFSSSEDDSDTKEQEERKEAGAQCSVVTSNFFRNKNKETPAFQV